MITATLLSPGAPPREIQPEHIGAALRAQLLWVDILADDRSESEPLLRDVFHFHPLTIDDCFNTLIDPPKIDDYGAYLFVIIHDIRYDRDAEAIVAVELDMYIGPNFVVTVHREPVDAAIDAVRKRIAVGAGHVTEGADFLGHAVFDVVVDDFLPVVGELDEEVDRLEELVLRKPERPTLEALRRLKRNTQRLKRSIMPLRDVANRFSRGEFERLVSQPALIYYRDIYDHTVRLEEMIDHMRDVADAALNTYLSSVNNRTNEVMKALTIVTVIILPMSLLTGIYGTNFEETFPGYDADWGFAAMVGSFVVIGTGLVLWLRSRRWL